MMTVIQAFFVGIAIALGVGVGVVIVSFLKHDSDGDTRVRNHYRITEVFMRNQSQTSRELLMLHYDIESHLSGINNALQVLVDRKYLALKEDVPPAPANIDAQA